METTFKHRISKGSRFNQIYIPKEMERTFKVGNLVEIRLIEKELFYSKNLKLGEFKEKLIKEIFSFLSQYKQIEQSYIVGSFLTSKADYNDIDIILIAKKDIKEVHNYLTDKFNLKFHVICMTKENLEKLLRIDPLTRSMFYYCASHDKLPEFKKEIDKKHLQFLLMMPEDLLEINTSSKLYYDSLRRLLTIEKFLENKSEDPQEINRELQKLIKPNMLLSLKANEIIEGKALEEIRDIIKSKLKIIKGIIKGRLDE